MTVLPAWLQRVSCSLIAPSASIRASICAGPNTVVSDGKR